MKIAACITAIAVLAIAAPAGAQSISPTAKRVTKKLLAQVAMEKGMQEGFDPPAAFGTARWGARVTAEATEKCKVRDRRHGSCGYTLDGMSDDTTKSVVCHRRVFVTLAKRRPHKLKTRVRKSACVVTPIPGAIPH